MQKNIHLKAFFYPLSSMLMYKSKKHTNKIEYKLTTSSINLPSGYNLKINEIKKVCDIIKKFLKLEKVNILN
jgi:dTDP-4-amino-4,6-dideoxygalactose transaminase